MALNGMWLLLNINTLVFVLNSTCAACKEDQLPHRKSVMEFLVPD